MLRDNLIPVSYFPDDERDKSRAWGDKVVTQAGTVNQSRFKPRTLVAGLLAVVDCKRPQIPCSSSHQEDKLISALLECSGREAVWDVSLGLKESHSFCSHSFGCCCHGKRLELICGRMRDRVEWRREVPVKVLLDQPTGQLLDTWVRPPFPHPPYPQIIELQHKLQPSHQQTTEINRLGPDQKSCPSCLAIPAIPQNHELTNKCLMC